MKFLYIHSDMQKPYLEEHQLKQILLNKGLFTPLVEKAINQSKKSHEFQLRDNGKSYLEEHIYPVTLDLLICSESFDNIDPEMLIVCGLLHDCLEDDENFTKDMCINNFSGEIYSIIKPLTKTKYDNRVMSQDEKYLVNKRYLQNLENASIYSKLIKLSDKYNNLSSIFTLGYSERFIRYINEIKDFYLPFAKQYSLYHYNNLSNKLIELENLFTTFEKI